MKILDMYKIDLHGLKDPVKFRFLKLSPIFYKWVIEIFGPCTEIIKVCFDDILESCVCADLYLQQNPDQVILGDMKDSAFKSILSLYRDYCDEKVPFKILHLQYLTKSRAIDIIKPFFEIALPNILHLYGDNAQKNRSNNKLKVNYKNEVDVNEWIKKLEDLDDTSSETFKNLLAEFSEKNRYILRKKNLSASLRECKRDVYEERGIDSSEDYMYVTGITARVTNL
ncbi:15567_t:CDS:2 [Gigaspora margarita]|uniref:15567_t:CDS:1 n=1 Tax=Gigaspora margarita TaxID=4874 RepID=A0ABN7VLU1_GIGMA|nr:15567_t:CDS:2 [Gigaspora margarita]